MANLTYDFSEVTDDQLDGASWVDHEGDYKVTVTAVDDTFTQDEKAILVDMQVDEGQPASQVGRRHRERLYPTPKAMARILSFAVACGLGSREQLKQSKAALDLTRAVGHQMIVKIVGESYETDDGTKKTRYKIGYLDFAPVKSTPAAANRAVSPASPPAQANSKSAYADL